MTLKSRLRITQGHRKWNHWTDHTRLTISPVIWRSILSWRTDGWTDGRTDGQNFYINIVRDTLCRFIMCQVATVVVETVHLAIYNGKTLCEQLFLLSYSTRRTVISLNGSSDSVNGDLQFLGYGNRQILIPTKSKPLNRSTKNRHSWLRWCGEPLYQIWYKSIHWGLMSKLVKCNKN